MAGGVNYLSDHNSRPALDWLMPENPPSSTTRYALAIIGLTALCTGWLWSSMNTAAVTSDVSQAISVARNLAAGDGITTDIIYYEEHHRIGRVPAAQTVFPPGLPLCLALLQPFVTDPLSGAMIVAATGFFLVPIATFLLGRRLGLSAQASCLVAALWLTVGTAWTNALHLATDVPFLALTLLSANSLADPRASRRRLLLSGLLAAAALLFRYAGLFFIAAAGLTLLIEWLLRHDRQTFARVAAFGVPSVGTALALFSRNYSLVGDIKGGNSYGGGKTLIDCVRGVYRALSNLTGFDRTRLFDANPAEWLALAAGVLLIVQLVRQRRRLIVELQRSGFNRTATLALGYCMITLVMLVMLERNSLPGSRDRMFMAALPFAMLLAAWTVQRLAAVPGNHRTAVALGGLLSLAFALGQVDAARVRSSRPDHSVNIVRLRHTLQAPVGETTLQELLQALVSRDAPLLANEPQRTGLLLQRPVIGLPSPLYSPTRWDQSTVPRVIRRYGIRHVLVFTDNLSMHIEDIPFYQQLASGHVPDWLEPVHVDQHDHPFALYRVRSDRLPATETPSH